MRFVDGRPVSAVANDFLAWIAQRLAKEGKKALLLLGDNASWHNSKKVHSWIREHNSQVRRAMTGVRILPLFLPKQSPWLNPIEPKWVHGKRTISEADHILSADELEARVCAYYGSPREPHLVMPKKVS